LRSRITTALSRALLFVLVWVLAGCGGRAESETSSPIVPDTMVSDAGSGSDAATSAEVTNSVDATAAPDTAVPDTGPTEPVDPYPEDWLAPPSGLCSNSENLAVVKYVVDGDTLELNGSDRVRLIGVDAPEVFSEDCWSGEATDALAALASDGDTVCLRADSNSSPTDPYGRLLRYVFVRHGDGWAMANARLVRLGAARAYHNFLKGKDYRKEIEVAEEEAFADHAGGWSACGW